ncbi:MAG: S6e family ribosomal protein [Nanoarchaeota archaeon]
MAFKINLSEKTGKTYKLEAESAELQGKSIREKISGKDISPELAGYEFEIPGASDKAGFPSVENVEGISLKKILLTYGRGLHKRPRKEGKKLKSNMKPKGLRMRKTVRGKTISQEIVQVNLKVLKEGSKKLSEIFPEQNKPKEKKEETKPQDTSN